MLRSHRTGLTFEVRDRAPAGPLAPPGPTAGRIPPDRLTAGTVLLLHGYPQDSGCWERVAAALTASGLRTLAPDQRGYSPDASPVEVRAYRMHELVADALAVLDAAGVSRAHVVGHDWGGAVAWSLAMAAPDRVATLTVLSTPHPAAMAWAFRHRTQALRSWYMIAFRLPKLPERLSAGRMGPVLRRSGLPPEHADRYARRFATPESLTGPINWYRAMRWRTPSARAGSDAGDGLFVRVPTTYLWGRRDPFLGRAAASRTGQYVSGPYRYVEMAAGHWLPETRPEQVAQEILNGMGR